MRVRPYPSIPYNSTSLSLVKVNVTGLYQRWLILQYHTSDTAATLNVLGYFRPTASLVWAGKRSDAAMVFLKLFLVLRRRACTVSMNRFRPWDPSMTKEWKSATRAQIFNFWELPKAWEALLAFLLKPKASWSPMKISSNKNPTGFERKTKWTSYSRNFCSNLQKMHFIQQSLPIVELISFDFIFHPTNLFPRCITGPHALSPGSETGHSAALSRARQTFRILLEFWDLTCHSLT